jgi:diguanylate cyclase (GGDEF)-like protein/PAS domain S-box-containing protein
MPEWEVVRTSRFDMGGKSRIVYLQNPQSKSKNSFRLSFLKESDGQWLLLFTELWKPIEDFKNISELILNHLDDAFIFVDKDYRIRTFNNAANLFSIKRIQEPLSVGANIMDFFPKHEDWEIIESQLRIGFSGKRSAFYLSESGARNYSNEFMVLPLRGIQEEILGVLIINKNSKKRSGVVMDANQDNLFNRAFSAMRSPALLWKKSDDGRILLEKANQSAESFFSDNIQERVGAEVEDFFIGSPDIVTLIKNSFDHGVEKQLETQLYSLIDDKNKWVQIDVLNISSYSILLSILDIDEQRKVEFALRENQRQLTTLFENLPGMAYRCKNDLDWTMEFVSAGVEDLTGYPNEDLIDNRRISYANLIHPDDRQYVWDTIQSGLEKKQKFEMRYRIETINKQEKWVWEKGQGIFADDGSLLAIEGFISDVTAQVYSELEAEKAMLQAQALKQALEEMSSELDLSVVLRRILVSLKTVLDYDSATLFLKEQDRLKVVAARGFKYTAKLINKTFPAKDLLLKEIQAKKAPIILEDAQNDPRFNHWEGADHVRGWMGVPLLRHDNFVGLMTLDCRQPGAYTEEDAKLAISFANSAAIVIENARLFEQTQQMALTDTLTGIYNRRYFYELAQKEFVRSKRYQDPLSVIMIDLDHFKNINDKFGHLAGDQILVQFVERIQSELRETDIFGRFGGEEFIVLLPETNLGDATQVAERLREVTGNYPFLLVTSQTFMTISLGVSCFKFTTVSLDQLIDESDKALYEAKQLGRNRVRIWRHD